MTTLLAFLVVIFVLVIVHEYGHYLAARLAGVKVLRFSIGFGKPIFTRRMGADNTEWTLSALPLGGYVKMLDEREGEVDASEVHRTFNRASVLRRIIIVAAGPLANFLLAILIFWALFIHGIPAIKPIIGEPAQGTPAAAAGLRAGDEVAQVDGNRVHTFSDLRLALAEAASRKAKPVLELANGERKELDFGSLPGAYDEGDGKLMGVEPYMPPIEPVIGRVEPGSVAEKSGLRAGDRILAVDGRGIAHWDEFAQFVRERPGQEIELQFLSGTEQRGLRVTPAILSEKGKQIGRIGVGPRIDPAVFERFQAEERYAPVQAMVQAVARTWDTSVFSLKMMGRMVLGQVSWRNLSGPVSIADYAGQSAQQGWLSFAGFLAIVSIGLGVINLLPVPLLDGGHLMYYFVEVFRGRPVSERVMELGARIGMVIIGALIFLALYNDMLRLLNE